MEVGFRGETSLSPVKKAANWQLHGLIFATLYCVFMNAAPRAFGVPVMWAIAFLLALRLGGWQYFWGHYRRVVWGVLALTAFSVLSARLPGRAVVGGYELLRSLSLILPALVLVAQDVPQQVLNWLKAYVLIFSLLFLAMYLTGLAPPGPYEHMYAWAFAHFGNPHNLINVSALVLLGAVVLLVFEDRMPMRAVLAVLCAFSVWVQWVLQSEGAYLALGICACTWVALRYGGALRVLGGLGVCAGVAVYVLLMLNIELAKASLGLSLESFEIRAIMNERLLALVAERPWVGYGMNNFKGLADTAVLGVLYVYPHQIYLEALFSFGVLGCALFVAVIHAVFRFSSRSAIVADPLAMLGFLLVMYMAGKGLTDMKLIDIQPLGIFMLGAGFMARRSLFSRPLQNLEA